MHAVRRLAQLKSAFLRERGFPLKSKLRVTASACFMAPKKVLVEKRKAKVEDEVDLAGEDESPPQKKPRAKAKPKAAPKTEPYDADNGWHIVPPSLIWKCVHGWKLNDPERWWM